MTTITQTPPPPKLEANAALVGVFVVSRDAESDRLLVCSIEETEPKTKVTIKSSPNLNSLLACLLPVRILL